MRNAIYHYLIKKYSYLLNIILSTIKIVLIVDNIMSLSVILSIAKNKKTQLKKAFIYLKNNLATKTIVSINNFVLANFKYSRHLTDKICVSILSFSLGYLLIKWSILRALL